MVFQPPGWMRPPRTRPWACSILKVKREREREREHEQQRSRNNTSEAGGEYVREYYPESQVKNGI